MRMDPIEKAELLSGAYGIVRENVDMATLTTFRVGGPCDVLVEVTSEKEALRTVRFLRTNAIPFTVIGNGSNLLVRDGGIRGVVLKMGSKFADVEVRGNRIIAQAGAMLSMVSQKGFRAGLSGMEALSGIPGSVGGGVIMNAGAYESEMKDVVCSIRAINDRNELVELSLAEMDMGYRTSRMMREHMVVTEVTFDLHPDAVEAIMARYQDYTTRRTTKQPLEKFSAGSTFKRPVGYFAGKLISDAGLRGYEYHGAQVSEKHCGFVVNNGTATASDVLHVIRHVQETVQAQFGVTLEPEVRIIGEDGASRGSS